MRTWWVVVWLALLGPAAVWAQPQAGCAQARAHALDVVAQASPLAQTGAPLPGEVAYKVERTLRHAGWHYVTVAGPTPESAAAPQAVRYTVAVGPDCAVRAVYAHRRRPGARRTAAARQALAHQHAAAADLWAPAPRPATPQAASQAAPSVQVASGPRGTPRLQAEGTGYAFLTDPNDGDAVPVTLPRLYGDGTQLDGTYARVYSARLEPDGTPAATPDGSTHFPYLPRDQTTTDCTRVLEDCDPFDAVNTYYHLDRVAQTFWVERMGLAIDFQVEAVVHNSGEGAFADWTRALLNLNLGETFFQNAARSDDLLYHEYAHLVTGWLGFAIDITSPDEARALNEGYADYFTATYTDDPAIGEWAITCPDRQHCIGPPNDPNLRTLLTESDRWNWRAGQPEPGLEYGVCTRFHEGDGKCKISYNNFTPTYVWGMIWGSALWDLRTALGADVVDALVLQGLLLVHPHDLTFVQAVEGLLLADAMHHGGQYATVIEQVMARRGFYPSDVTATASLPARTTLQAEPAYPNPFVGGTTLRFTLPQPTEIQLVIYDLLGRVVARPAQGLRGAGRQAIGWDASGQAPGRYLARLTTPTGSYSWPLLLHH